MLSKWFDCPVLCYTISWLFIIAAQEELAVAVGGDVSTRPCRALDLADRLEDDRHAHVSAAHGGDEDRESWYLPMLATYPAA